VSTKTFVGKFEKYLAGDTAAKCLVDKVVRLGFQREAVIGMVGEVTDPVFRKKLAGACRKFNGEILPRKSRAALSKRLRTTAKKLQASFGNPIIGLHPASERFVALAQTLNDEAAVLDRFPAPKVGRLFSDKAFGRHVLRVALCVRLDAPKTVSFNDIEQLLWFGADARGLQQRPYGDSRSLEREYKWFTKTIQWQILLFWNKSLRLAHLSRTSLWQ
jgi:hypothetical protein